MAEISSNSAKVHPVKGDIASATHGSICERYHVLGDIPLGDFVSFIRFMIGKHGYAWKRPMFVYFKNTDPPIVDEKNKDDDGFLRITYSGKESGGWTNSSALSR